MNDILLLLVSSRAELERRGVLHAAVFGSVVRGEAGRASDVDVLVDLDPAASVTLPDYVDLQDYLTILLDRPVDLVNRKTLKPLLRNTVLSEAVDVF